MNSKNILIGIDLGTTNSEIVANKDGNIEIIKNVFGDEHTPSVFGVDKSKNKVVGKRAYERLYKDTSEEETKNYKAEIKRLMGTPEAVYFERLDLKMTAEEISAEILNSLKEDVLRKYPDFEVDSVVITVPAYFSVLQSEATKKAGNIAGFKYVVLLQEPISAAISYGFMNSKNENWLIYDLGGGTFDVALISSKDGVLSVLSHGGDNFLGGKDFDWIIVDNVIVPAILNDFSLADFNRGNEKYRSFFAKLKYIAENAKIYLSQYDKVFIEVDMIGKDDNGKDIYLSIEFTRKDFEDIIKSTIDRTIEVSQDVIKESGVNISNINKVILVGGSTQIPYVKKRIEDELKITIDSSVDPFTVVARGACIYAISQQIPKDYQEKTDEIIPDGAKVIKLNYDTLTSLDEETITGVIDELKDIANNEYFIEIKSDNEVYKSEKIKLEKGSFVCNVKVEPNKINKYVISLTDKNGNSITVYPDTFSITHGLSVSAAPIPHSIGVAVAKKDPTNNFVATEVFEHIFEKGSTLPLSSTEKFKTARKLKKVDENNPLWIRVGEGESDIPDRNIFVCELGIKGSDLPYDLDEGTDIELTIDVNESRELFVTVYVPDIDLTLNARSTYKDEVLDATNLEEELNKQIERFSKIESSCSDVEKEKIGNLIDSISSSIKNASIDEDEKRKANKQIKDLKMSLDTLEQDKEIVKLTQDFYGSIETLESIINEYGDEKERDANMVQYNDLKKEGESAIKNNDKTVLKTINEKAGNLASKIYYGNSHIWPGYFNKLVDEHQQTFSNNEDAQYYINRGHKAMQMNDMEEVKQSVKNLMMMLPTEQQAKVDRKISGITR